MGFEPPAIGDYRRIADRFRSSAQPGRDARRSALHGNTQSNLSPDRQSHRAVNSLKDFNWAGWSSLFLALALWEIAARVAPGLRLYLPPFTAVISALGQLLLSGSVAAHLFMTL